MWPRGWVEVQLYSSITAALEGGEWSAAHPGRTLPPGKTRYPFYRRLGGPQGRSGGAENLVPTGIRSRTVQPVVSRYTDWAAGPTGKDRKDVKSYRSISSLPIIAKQLEKLILRRIDPDFTPSEWIPHHHFGFRQTHSTIQQCRRITHTTLKAINNKEHCTSVFLDVSQAFDMVWHPGPLHKIKNHLKTFFPL